MSSPTPQPPRPAVVWALMLAVGVVLADSSVVTLALPDIVEELDASVGHVTWVLTAYNLALALAAMPAAWLAARATGARRGALAGAALFAAACVGCAVAGSLEVLIGARIAQALGGALLVTAALELLLVGTGARARGTALWAASGVAGTAIGPFAGGVLTEAFSWQSIFIVQVPMVLLVLPAIAALRVAGDDARTDRAGEPAAPDRPSDATVARRVADDATLFLVSAALTAALFLVVLLLIEGWRRTPITAALTVTVMPAAAIAARAAVHRFSGAGAGAAAEIPGAILIAGGLGALGLLPGSALPWIVLPQLLIGVGLALTIEPLTARSLQGASPVRDSGRNLAVRHFGIVAGLALLTPIFLAGLDDAERPAREAVTALVVDAPLPAPAKLSLATELVGTLEQAGSRIPDLEPAFAAAEIDPADRPAAEALQARLDDQLDRAATQAFRDAFLVAAVLALLAALAAAVTTALSRNGTDATRAGQAAPRAGGQAPA